MEFRYVPLNALGTYASGLTWHDPRLKSWMQIYREMGIVRPLVINVVNGHLLTPPGELEALKQLQAEEMPAPEGTSRGWNIPVWLVKLAESEERRWSLVLAGGVDHALMTRPYDDSILTLLLDEAEQDMNHVQLFGMDLKQYRAVLELLTETDEPSLNSPFPGTSTAGYWGIPELDARLQADRLYPSVKWGAGARSSDLSGSLVHFYAEDSKFTALVNDSTPVMAAHPAAAVEVNFSTSPAMSRALVLYRTFQKRSISRRWQQAGIPLLVDLNVDTEFADINLLGVPLGWRSYAVRAYAKDLEHLERAYAWATGHCGEPADVLFVVYGGGKRASELCSARGWAWLAEDSDQIRGRNGAGQASA